MGEVYYNSTDFHPRWKRWPFGVITPMERVESGTESNEIVEMEERVEIEEHIDQEILIDAPTGSSTQKRKSGKGITYNDVLSTSKELASYMSSKNKLAEYHSILSLMIDVVSKENDQHIDSLFARMVTNMDALSTREARALTSSSMEMTSRSPGPGRPKMKRIESVPSRMKPRPKTRRTSCAFCDEERHKISSCPKISKLGVRFATKNYNEWKSYLQSRKICRTRADISTLPPDWKNILLLRFRLCSNVSEPVCKVAPIVRCLPEKKRSIWILSTQVEQLILSTVKTVIITSDVLKSLAGDSD
tara:strand:- start:724 stop:1632 length:909 start_codon:yes stop_codon:yes gene_type:complete